MVVRPINHMVASEIRPEYHRLWDGSRTTFCSRSVLRPNQPGRRTLEAAAFSFVALTRVRNFGCRYRKLMVLPGVRDRLRTKGVRMTTTFLVTITTAEELRLLEQEKRAGMQSEREAVATVFDESDDFRAHGLGVTLEAGQ